MNFLFPHLSFPHLEIDQAGFAQVEPRGVLRHEANTNYVGPPRAGIGMRLRASANTQHRCGGGGGLWHSLRLTACYVSLLGLPHPMLIFRYVCRGKWQALVSRLNTISAI